MTLEYITHADFLAAEAASAYYAGRWEYMAPVVYFLDKLRLDGPSLELGCHTLPIVVGGETMDRDWRLSGVTYPHDATTTPWLCEDKQFELFIALQVWEHLRGQQAKCFGEVLRVAKRAVLSVPYRWECADHPEHRMITAETVHRWTMGIPPTTCFVVCRRLILYYDWSGPADRVINPIT